MLQLLEAAERAVQKHSLEQREHAAHKRVNYEEVQRAWNTMLEYDRATGVSSVLESSFTKKTPKQLRLASGRAAQRHFANQLHAAMQGSSGAPGSVEQIAAPGSAGGNDHAEGAAAAAAAINARGTAGPPEGLAEAAAPGAAAMSVEAGQQQHVPAAGSSPVKDAFAFLMRRASSFLHAGLPLHGGTAAATSAGLPRAPGTAGPLAAAAGGAVAGSSAGGAAAVAVAGPPALGLQQAGAKRVAHPTAAGRAPKRACKSGADRKPTTCSHCNKEGHNKRTCPELQR